MTCEWGRIIHPIDTAGASTTGRHDEPLAPPHVGDLRKLDLPSRSCARIGQFRATAV